MIVYSYIKDSSFVTNTDNANDSVSILTVFKKATPFALVMSVFWFQLISWDHVTNQFPFVYYDQKILAVYQLIGTAWHASIYSQYTSSTKNYRALWFLGWFISQAALWYQIYTKSDLVLTILLSLTSAFCQGYFICSSLSYLYQWIATQTSDDTKVFNIQSRALAVQMLWAGLMIIPFEQFYYTNRDI